MQIDYRKLKSSEAPDFRRVRLECLKKFPESFGTLYEDEVGKAKLYFEELIEQDSADVFFFGAFAGDDLIGIAGFVRGERTKTRHRGEIAAMYVNPGFAVKESAKIYCARLSIRYLIWKASNRFI